MFGLSTICIITEMKMGASDMPLRLEFDNRLSRSIKKRLKGSEETELRKADRTVGVNCNIFFNISSGTA